jgi:hypothetical protein
MHLQKLTNILLSSIKPLTNVAPTLSFNSNETSIAISSCYLTRYIIKEGFSFKICN